MPITTSQDPVRNQYKVLSAIDECVSVGCSGPVRKPPSRTDMQREAVRATTRRWSRRGWRCPWHPDPRVGAAMTETSVRASHGPSPPRSACTKSWSGVYALCGELPLMPFASLVLGGAPPPNAMEGSLLLTQLHICLPSRDTGSPLGMGGPAIVEREADTQLCQQQARCPPLAVAAADRATSASTAPADRAPSGCCHCSAGRISSRWSRL